MMLAARLVLMWSTMAASVVVFPEPVGPVTSTKPRCSSANLVTTGGRPSSVAVQRARQHTPEDETGRTTLAKGVTTEPAQAVGRKREVGFAGLFVLLETVRRQDHLDEVFALLVPDGRERRHPQVAVDPALGGEPTLMCKSDAPCSTTWRRTAGKSITGTGIGRYPRSPEHRLDYGR